MQKNKSKRFVKKDSTHKSSSAKLLQILQRIFNGIGGTISYVFLEERIRFTKEYPNGEKYFRKSIRHSPINHEVFYKVENGKTTRRSPSEVIEVFETTKNDIGASYYVID